LLFLLGGLSKARADTRNLMRNERSASPSLSQAFPHAQIVIC
jgi:hypothetical protein